MKVLQSRSVSARRHGEGGRGRLRRALIARQTPTCFLTRLLLALLLGLSVMGAISVAQQPPPAEDSQDASTADEPPTEENGEDQDEADADADSEADADDDADAEDDANDEEEVEEEDEREQDDAQPENDDAESTETEKATICRSM